MLSGIPNLEGGFPLRCFQRLSFPYVATQRLRLAAQLEHQRYVHPGPLVLRTALLKYPAPTVDRDQTVSRRFKPSSRTALIGEQPNPWDLLQPQDAMSRHQVPNLPVDVNSWGRSACYPRSTFYPLSDGPSIQNRRITMTYFRTCSTCWSRSQAPLCHCTLRPVSNRAEGTFARLRYSLGGDRPSQTTHQTVSPTRFTGPG